MAPCRGGGSGPQQPAEADIHRVTQQKAVLAVSSHHGPRVYMGLPYTPGGRRLEVRGGLEHVLR